MCQSDAENCIKKFSTKSWLIILRRKFQWLGFLFLEWWWQTPFGFLILSIRCGLPVFDWIRFLEVSGFLPSKFPTDIFKRFFDAMNNLEIRIEWILCDTVRYKHDIPTSCLKIDILCIVWWSNNNLPPSSSILQWFYRRHADVFRQFKLFPGYFETLTKIRSIIKFDVIFRIRFKQDE